MEMKEFNIAEILKDCPKLTALYSPMYGRVLLEEVDLKNHRIRVSKGLISNIELYKDGRFTDDGECMLFPSYNQRDWSEFRKPITPPFEIKPPKPGEVFFFVNALGEVQKIEDKEHIGVENDSIRRGFELGNYFNTREQAEYAAKKVKDLLLSLRKEE